MIVGAAATAVMTFLTARSAMLAFESKCALADNLIEQHIKIETVKTVLFNDTHNTLVFHSKSERRTWRQFEELVIRISRAYNETHSLGLKIDDESIYNDAMHLAGDPCYAHVAQGGQSAIVANNIATALIKYVRRDMGWLQHPSTVSLQVWLADQLEYADHHVVVSACALIAHVEGRSAT